jgi:hypothetical protein
MEYKTSRKGCFKCGNRMVAPSFSFFPHGHAEKPLSTWSRVVLRLRGIATTTGEKASEHGLSPRTAAAKQVRHRVHVCLLISHFSVLHMWEDRPYI